MLAAIVAANEELELQRYHKKLAKIFISNLAICGNSRSSPDSFHGDSVGDQAYLARSSLSKSSIVTAILAFS